jgi:alpha-beta hydrolase superfamily lysophospholipase
MLAIPPSRIANDLATRLRQVSTKEDVSEPLYFTSGDHELFAWLHRPAVPSPASVGLVICKPFGYEALCAHRSVRTFAESAAKLGVPALRFDYLGCGDSADIDPDADQITVWVEDILAAVDELRRLTGVEHVCLLGVRLGALLAMLAAARSTSIKSLVLVAPVIRGKRYLRELRTARLAAQMGADPRAASYSDADVEATPGSMEFSGYPMSAASMDTLSKIDLAKLSVPPVSHALVLDRHDLPIARSWYEALLAAGVTTQYLELSGFVEMALVAPQFAVVPDAMTQAISSWLKHMVGNLEARPEPLVAVVPPTAASTAPPELRFPNGSNDDGPRERPVSFGSDTSLFGIVTQPSPKEVRRRGVVLINAGADHHMGPSRMHVSLARRWARSGYYVLRMDLAGLGDSDTRAGKANDETFPPAALDDIRDAVAFLRERYEIREVTLMGLCSGAYHALRAAAAGLPVERVLLVNPQNYYWAEDMNLADLQLAEVVRNPGVYRERIQSASAWRRLLSGQVNVWRIFKIYVYRQVLSSEAVFRNVARVLRIKLRNDLGGELEEIVGRRVQVTFIFADGEPGIDLLKIQGGSSVKKLGDYCRVLIIKDADHTFSHSGPRSAMERVLSDELNVLRAIPTTVSPKGQVAYPGR